MLRQKLHNIVHKVCVTVTYSTAPVQFFSASKIDFQVWWNSVVDPGCLSRILDPDLSPSRILNPRSNKKRGGKIMLLNLINFLPTKYELCDLRPSRVRPLRVRFLRVRPLWDRTLWVRPSWVRPSWVRPLGIRSSGVRTSWVQTYRVSPSWVRPSWVVTTFVSMTFMNNFFTGTEKYSSQSTHNWSILPPKKLFLSSQK